MRKSCDKNVADVKDWMTNKLQLDGDKTVMMLLNSSKI